jgi:membrane protein CcdC involved in cytochrome C biogenesis
LLGQSANITPHSALMLGTAMMAMVVLLLRLRSARKPVRELFLLLPPLGMSTGFSMFLIPSMRIPPEWGLAAFAAGATLLSYPLIRTTMFEIRCRKIYMKRSRAFMVIIVVLLALRLSLHSYIGMYVTVRETASIFFILAFGMLLPWRIAMYLQYQYVLERMYRSKDKECTPTAKKDITSEI